VTNEKCRDDVPCRNLWGDGKCPGCEGFWIFKAVMYDENEPKIKKKAGITAKTSGSEPTE
jgi:hypothetical protein